MTVVVPTPIVPGLDALVDGVRAIDGTAVGAYVSGSVALDAWDPLSSDIDVIVVTREALRAGRVDRLAALHGRLADEHPMAARLDVQYLSLCHLGTDQPGGYPCWRDGAFRRDSRGDLNATTRWLLREHGLTLFGPTAATLPLTVTWADVLGAMRFNLTRYWPAQVSADRRVALRGDDAVVFAVTTLCRILTTIEGGVIVTKPAALAEWSNRVPTEWGPILHETGRLLGRTGADSPFPDADSRADEVRQFIRWATDRGLASLGESASSLPAG